MLNIKLSVFLPHLYGCNLRSRYYSCGAHISWKGPLHRVIRSSLFAFLENTPRSCVVNTWIGLILSCSVFSGFMERLDTHLQKVNQRNLWRIHGLLAFLLRYLLVWCFFLECCSCTTLYIQQLSTVCTSISDVRYNLYLINDTIEELLFAIQSVQPILVGFGRLTWLKNG